MMKARALWIGVLALLIGVVGPSPTRLGPSRAAASVSVALSLQELVNRSDRAVVALALQRHSVWEEVAGSKRIVTYTELKTAQTVYGKPSSSLWVRTLGGVVGKIGQHVAGEARLALGQRCLLFITQAPDGVSVVTGRAQGHYPLHQTDEGRELVRASPDRGKVIRRRGPTISAHAQLVGSELATALQHVRKAHQNRKAQ